MGEIRGTYYSGKVMTEVATTCITEETRLRASAFPFFLPFPCGLLSSIPLGSLVEVLLLLPGPGEGVLLQSLSL